MASTKQYWIYHERQEALLCGQHALNNLVQQNAFTTGSLAEIANQLDAMELNYMAQNNEGGVKSKDYLKRMAEGSGNVDESGNFSIEVLRSALMGRFELELPNIRQQGVRDKVEITDIDGFICNRASHWFAIRKINDRFYNLNSTLEKPEIISHFKLAAEMQALQDAGYSVFCIVDKNPGLPPPCSSEQMMQGGLPQYWWKEEDLFKGKSNAMTKADDPWQNVGGGRRLDGKSGASSGGGGGGNSAADMSMSGLTEDEMLQMAMAASLEPASLEPQSAPSSSNDNNNNNNNGQSYELTEEPAEGATGAVKIQFRLPDGKRAVRRFLGSDRVGVIYAFVAGNCSNNQSGIELRAGFPPKDISSRKESTIADANLAGEMIHGRYV